MNRVEGMQNRHGSSRKPRQAFLSALLLLVGLHATAVVVAAQGTTEFTFQGQLKLDGVPVNGNYDFQFSLYLTDSPLGDPEVVDVVYDVPVVAGLFTVKIDFGLIFDGTELWMQTCVQPAGGGEMTCLYPLHEVTPVPYAVSAVNAANLGGLDASQYLTSEVDPSVAQGGKTGCRICIGWSDANGSMPTEEQCHNLNTTSIDYGNYLQFDGNVDGNDRLWLWVECP